LFRTISIKLTRVYVKKIKNVYSALEVLILVIKHLIKIAYTLLRTVLPVVLIRKPERKKVYEVAREKSVCP